MKSHFFIFCIFAFLMGGCDIINPQNLPSPTATYTPTSTPMPTITPTSTSTPKPTITPTSTSTPTPTKMFPDKPYTILYDFDEVDIDPILEQQIPQNCTLNKIDGIQYIECKSDNQKDTYMKYIPRGKEELRGVAMLAHVDAPYDEKWGRINPMVHFAKPGNPDTREYTIALRKGIIKVVEYYPAREGFPYKVLGEKPIPTDKQNDFHLLQIEFINGELQFFLDKEPIILETQPDLPQGYVWESWKFELVLFEKPSTESKILIAQIDYFSLLK